MARDYYQILGISNWATQDEIKKNYRKLAKQYHPDTNRGSLFAEERFKEIAQAYQTLSNGEKRREYDLSLRMMRFRFRPAGYTRPTGRQPRNWRSAWETGPKKEKPSRPKARPQEPMREKGVPRPGRDTITDIRIPLELAAKGGSTRMWIEQEIRCSLCSGSGAKPGTKVRRCSICQGTGQVEALGLTGGMQPCRRCEGRGVIIRTACSVCKGSGHIARKVLISVPVSRGVRNGDQVRLVGRGQPGRFGGAPGDLYLRIKIEPHSQFRRFGYHIETTASIDIFTAALGGKIIVPTLNGNAWLVVPAGTRSGTRLRLKGKGLPQPDGESGDQHVVVAIVPPKDLSEEQKNLLRQMARKFR